MIIKKIQYDDKKGWFIFEGDDQSRFCVSYEFYIKLDLHKGSSVDHKLFSLLEREDQKNRAMDTAKNYVLNRPRTVKEVHDRLWREKISEDLIQDTLSFLLERGYLDDALYGEKYARDKSRLRHWSRKKIALKLKGKGLSSSDIDHALKELPQEKEEENLRHILEKKYGKRDLTDPQEFHRVYQAMVRRGFAFSEVLNIMKEKAEEENKNQSF